MMKSLICLLFVLFSVNCFSQTKEIKVSKKDITASKAINDFIKDIPKDCKVTSFIFSSELNVGYREFSCMGEGLPAEIKNLLAKLGKGKNFFIEKIQSDCLKSHAQKYKIILN